MVSKEENCNYCCSFITCLPQPKLVNQPNKCFIAWSVNMFARGVSFILSLCFPYSRAKYKQQNHRIHQVCVFGCTNISAYATWALDITASFMLLVARCLSFVCCPGNNNTSNSNNNIAMQNHSQCVIWLGRCMLRQNIYSGSITFS